MFNCNVVPIDADFAGQIRCILNDMQYETPSSCQDHIESECHSKELTASFEFQEVIDQTVGNR